MIDRIDLLPGPAWLAYLGAFAAVALAVNAVAWSEGSIPVGELDPYRTSLGVYVVFGYLGIHYLDRASSRALQAFRPATTLDDAEYAALEYELTTLPSGPTLAWTTFGLLLTVAYTVIAIDLPRGLSRAPLGLAFDFVTNGPAFDGGVVLAYHTIRQLRLINRIHRLPREINLFRLLPLHAFSNFTARTGVFFLLIVYVSAVTDPATLSSSAVLVPVAIWVALALSCFVVPLLAMPTGSSLRRIAS